MERANSHTEWWKDYYPYFHALVSSLHISPSLGFSLSPFLQIHLFSTSFPKFDWFSAQASHLCSSIHFHCSILLFLIFQVDHFHQLIHLLFSFLFHRQSYKTELAILLWISNHQSSLIALHSYLLHLTCELECRSGSDVYEHTSPLQAYAQNCLDCKANSWLADVPCSQTSNLAICLKSTNDETKHLKPP